MASEDDLDELREAGLKEDEIAETVQIVAIFNATNRLDAGLGIRSMMVRTRRCGANKGQVHGWTATVFGCR